MKRRNREINIFSMSALDLFASAMGAFMLLALVYLVFFTMTSRTSAVATEPAEPVVAVAEVECPALPEPPVAPTPTECPAVPDTQPLEDALAACRADQAEETTRASACETARAALGKRVEQLKFPHVDLVVALDVTGSMTGPLEGLKSEIDQLLDVMSKLAPSFAVGIVPFGDRRWQTPVYHQDLVEVKHSAANRALLKRVIAGLENNMGIGRGSNPDDPEAVLAALRTAVSSTWRREAERQIVVLVTDNPAYPEERAQALSAASRFAVAVPGRAVSTVFVDTSNRWRGRRNIGASEFLRNLAGAGNGQFVEDGGSMTANLLLSLL